MHEECPNWKPLSSALSAALGGQPGSVPTVTPSHRLKLTDGVQRSSSMTTSGKPVSAFVSDRLPSGEASVASAIPAHLASLLTLYVSNTDTLSADSLTDTFIGPSGHGPAFICKWVASTIRTATC